MSARVWAALSRGDDEIPLFVFDPDVEFNIIGPAPGGLGLAPSYRGHGGWREFIRTWRAEWAGLRITHTPEALIDRGDHVVMRVRLTARGAASGADVAQTMGIVAWFRDAAIVRQDNYWRWTECVKALGLDAVPEGRASGAH